MDKDPTLITPVQPSITQTPPGKKGKTKLKIGLIALVLLLVIGLIAAKYVTDKDDTPSQVDQTVTQETAEVFITETGFNPATITVKKGTTITWINQAASVHQIASDPHPTHDALPELFADEPMESGQTFTMTFEDTGTYTYHDHLRPFELKGMVIVE